MKKVVQTVTKRVRELSRQSKLNLILMIVEMDKMFKICGSKKIEIQTVPCCYDIARVIMHTAKQGYSYGGIWQFGIGQTAFGNNNCIQAPGKIKAFAFLNTTPHFVEMVATANSSYGSTNEKPEYFKVRLAPNEEKVVNFPNSNLLTTTSYSNGSNIGFNAKIYSDSTFTNLTPLTEGIVELSVITFDKCKPINGGSGSNNPSGSMGSSSNGTYGSGGIGEGVIDAWANAKLFPVQSNNQFFCGGSFGVAKILNFNSSLKLVLPYSDIYSSSGVIIELYDINNFLVQTFTQGLYNGGGVILASGLNIPESIVTKIVISASSYSTSNNSMCTNGRLTFTPQ